jgi:cytochrome c oxidase assembly protein subunit 15
MRSHLDAAEIRGKAYAAPAPVVTLFPMAEDSDRVQSERPGRRIVAVWLWTVAACLWAMIVLGGVVRLTGSGLSITVWDPIMGAVPPLSHADWEHAFSLYRASPEYKLRNLGMDLGSFQTIFWFEYFHRLLGRFIGVLLGVPLIAFALKRWIDRRLALRLGFLFLLGALQGLAGWYMVKSGLSDAPRVSHYRLTLHLGLGLLSFAITVWLAIEESFGRVAAGLARTRALCGFVFFTALSGGLVAGLHAGHAFPTFPLIAGYWIPPGLFAIEPFWRNFLDSALTVQFQHRLLAFGVFGFVVVSWWKGRHSPAKRALDLLLGVVLVQVTLGILTLLLDVPTALAAAHQGNAALLIAASLFTHHRSARRVPGVPGSSRTEVESARNERTPLLESAPAPRG